MRTTKINSVILLLLFIFVTASHPTMGQERIVEEIEIRGNKIVTREQILDQIKTRPTDRFQEKQVQQDFEQIMKMGKFDKLKSSVLIDDGPRGGKIIIFRLKEKEK